MPAGKENKPELYGGDWDVFAKKFNLENGFTQIFFLAVAADDTFKPRKKLYEHVQNFP